MAKSKALKEVDPEIVYEGTSIRLPADPSPMTLEAAIAALKRKAEDEKTLLDVHETIEHHPHDALVAFNWAMKETYGWASPQPKMTFFGPVAPDLVTVVTGPKPADFVQVPCGVFKLPNISENIELHRDFRHNVLHVTGQVRKPERQILVDLCNKAREYLKSNSIFRGKAIQLPCDGDGDPLYASVGYIETDNINVGQLVLNENEAMQVQDSIWTPIQQTARCVDSGVPLRRGVLLEGPYGTGKSLTGTATARVCVDNGWTYILLDNVRGLKGALTFAQRYQPCVIFAEDIDRAVEERDELGNDILNTISGVLSKDSQVITVLTTNFVDKIDRAMLRPGRLDAVISVREPEPEAVVRLVRLYAGDLLDQSEDLTRSSESMAGYIPATIAEIVVRAKLGMIGRGAATISDRDLYSASEGIRAHMALLNSQKPDVSDAEAAGLALKRLLDPGNISEFEEAMEDAAGAVQNAAHNAAQQVGRLERAAAAGSKRLGDKMDEIHADTRAIRRRVS